MEADRQSKVASRATALAFWLPWVFGAGRRHEKNPRRLGGYLTVSLLVLLCSTYWNISQTQCSVDGSRQDC